MTLTAKHKAITTFYQAREALQRQNVYYELGLREPFKALLHDAAKAFDFDLVVESSARPGDRLIRYDGVVRDVNKRERGYWEAKDPQDRLEDEIAKKFAAGYSSRNTLFEDSQQAILYQGGERVGTFDLNQPEKVAQLLNMF